MEVSYEGVPRIEVPYRGNIRLIYLLDDSTMIPIGIKHDRGTNTWYVCKMYPRHRAIIKDSPMNFKWIYNNSILETFNEINNIFYKYNNKYPIDATITAFCVYLNRLPSHMSDIDLFEQINVNQIRLQLIKNEHGKIA